MSPYKIKKEYHLEGVVFLLLGECCSLWLSRYFCWWGQWINASCRYTMHSVEREQAKGQRKFSCLTIKYEFYFTPSTRALPEMTGQAIGLVGLENSFICSTVYLTKHVLGPFSCPWLRSRGFPNTRTHMLSRFSHVWLFATLWTVSRQTFLSMGFSREEYWSGLLCPPPGDLHDPGTKSTSALSPTLVGRFFTASATWETED